MPQPQHTVQFIDGPDEVVRVVQLTDTHLCQTRGGTLLGMDTDHSLQAVIDLVKQERPDVHLLLGTGDLSDGGARPAYDRLQRYFDQLSPDNYWLPGNHDRREAMVAAASRPDRLCKEIRVARWQVLLLDSQVPGQVGGALGELELALLESALQVAEHVHQEIDRQRNGVRLLASPSTCVQFAAGCENFKADDQPPGYRWLELHSDGRIETAVSRVRDIHFEVELDSGGYL